MKQNLYGLILAGGRGTRFWPRSRRRHPKQVLRVFGDATMIQATVDRLSGVFPADRLWILTGKAQRPEIVRQLPAVPATQILAEPAQRNTASAIGLAAHMLHSVDPEAVVGVFPADHVILQPKRFLPYVRAALREAARGKIVVLGIQPRSPDTAFGYIEFPPGTEAGTTRSVPVLRFREKPKPALAKEFVAAGNFYWNAGMFFFRASAMLDALRRHLPKTATLLASLPSGTDPDFSRRLAKVFPLLEDISIDFAVMEKAGNVTGFPCRDFGWNDVGSWDAVYDLLPKDTAGNAARSEVIAQESRRNYVDAGGKLVTLIGVDDLIVVDTRDALLVADRRKAQAVGALVKLLEKQGRDDLL